VAALILLAGLFAIGFMVVAIGVGKVLPPLYAFQITPKLRQIEKHRGSFDVLFFGSSRVLRHFVTADFDAQLTAAGHPLHSFNCGIDAMPPPEVFYMLRQALALRPRARWIFIELWDIRTVADEGSLEVKRFIHWHDARHTLLVLRRLFTDSRIGAWEKSGRAAIHLRAAFRRCSQIGRGAEWLEPALLPPQKKKAVFEEPTPWLATGGFHPGPGEPMRGSKREQFEQSVSAIRTSFPTVDLPPLLREQAAVLAREIRATGAEPVFIAMPTVNGGENYADPRTQGMDADFISLVSPERFPLLYDPDRHNDEWHLTETGAHDFTRYLAGEFQALLESKPAGDRVKSPKK
jgi:hypothetical protein